jgi:nucleoid-associated protein YgaU
MAAITHPGFTFEISPRRELVRRHPASVYRRRRLVVAALLLGALLAGSWVLGALGGGSLTASEAGSTTAVELRMEPVSQATHVVAPGDTLWSIARQLVPEGDVRPVVDSLAAHRNGRPLQVGERITLP